MATTTSQNTTRIPATTSRRRRPEQLTLLPTDDVPPRFRLDAATVQRGRRHIAEIRQMLHSQEPSEPNAPPPLPPRQRRAA